MHNVPHYQGNYFFNHTFHFLCILLGSNSIPERVCHLGHQSPHAFVLRTKIDSPVSGCLHVLYTVPRQNYTQQCRGSAPGSDRRGREEMGHYIPLQPISQFPWCFRPECLLSSGMEQMNDKIGGLKSFLNLEMIFIN